MGSPGQDCRTSVLPALAELYGVSADDILAGETLDRGRGAPEKVAERKIRPPALSDQILHIRRALRRLAAPAACGPLEYKLYQRGWLIFFPPADHRPGTGKAGD